MSCLGIIGGTGIAQLQDLVVYTQQDVSTPYGPPSGPIQEGRLGDARVCFVHRHGGAATIPPHRINYRANIWALQALGVSEIVGINAVGGIGEGMCPGRLVIPDQLIDYTWGREHTFDEGRDGRLLHIDFTEPYSRDLRLALLAAADSARIDCERAGVHGVLQGPRLETAAEVRKLARDGCDLVGMTGMPEAALARELGLAYAAVCMVVNPAAGLGDLPLSQDAMHQILQREAAVVGRLLLALVAAQFSTPD
ncbi:S-methyl-5'-thioinosine phosphorylase [Parahaliea mediterranea]|uniref:S-methyl-5'-thioinosine phosphorylase n=1 Tax=Parahaliea mediterranea TaxID=651086 RepID=UPI000E2F6EF9|nr:S-methyl-5'-thioinosine phosphorylase [Parahaliea mediterranea]